MTKTTSKTILFITGAFVSNDCWREWQLFFEKKGYQTFAPAWPYKNETADVLRRQAPESDIAKQRLADLTAYFADFALALPEKPIIIGHSMGGLITQLLMQRNLAVAGIAIHSLQPKDVLTFKFSFYKAGWGPLGFFTSVKKSFLMSFRQWQYAFTNGMSFDEQKEAYYRLLTPESKLLVRDAITDAAKVDFTAPHVPLLFIAGSCDRFIPASLNHTNYSKYKDKDSRKSFKIFEGRNHYVLGQPGWEEVAGYTNNWLEELSY